MTRSQSLFASAAFLASLFAATASNAAALTVVNVGAPAINCVFNSACTVTVTDSLGNFTPTGDSNGARLQSRTFAGAAPAPAAGDTAYEYRVDLTQVKGLTAVNCVTAMTINFGPVVKLPYGAKGLAQVYVITSGGLGSVDLASAIQTGSKIKFTFSAPVCPGATSFFFGLASKKKPPLMSTAAMFFSLGGSAPTAVRVP